MLSFSEPSVYQSAKCAVTYGSMAHVEPQQTPHKGKPWNSILTQGFNHKIDLILPESCYELVKQKLVEGRPPPVYYNVTMALGDILRGDFFNEYIKQGNILMLSEGRTTVENVFSLQDGILTMYLDKETYQRAGLVGQPYGAKGNRKLKPRWIVSYQLRDPSMFRGKKGFDRLMYACKNVLNQPVKWLFFNADSTHPTPDPLQQFAPVEHTCHPDIVTGLDVEMPGILIPAEIVANGDRQSLELFATEIYEWLSLVRLMSPRVVAGDDVDSFLSRYEIPSDWAPSAQTKMCKLTWQGFFPAIWVRNLLLDVLTTVPSRDWFSLSATSFSKGLVGGSTEVSFLRQPTSPSHYLMWEIKGADS